MATQGIFGRPRVIAMGAAGAILLGGLLFVATRRDGARGASASSPGASITSSSPNELSSLRAAAEAGDDEALHALVDAMNTVAYIGDVVAREMMRSTRAELRAAACAWIGKHKRSELAALELFPRMSDQDWRVRAAAFEAARLIAGDAPATPKGDAPLRDTPVDQREPVIFAWINGWRTAGESLPALADHCELYADAGGHWLTGTKLAASCLACHAPPDKFATNDFIACASCHRQSHAEWSGSAHARSTTHLNLARVNDQTKQVDRFDYGQREGLVCTTCHVPVTATPSPRVRGEGGGEGHGARGVERPLANEGRSPLSPALSPEYREEGEKALPSGTESLFVPHRFAPATSAACATCHGDTQAEWDVWRKNPRPLASRWLPGEVTWDDGPEAQNCVACHVKRRSAEAEPGLRHDFGARRDVPFMRDGLLARIDPPAGGRGPALVLTNLAGHRYPSGTDRRALRIDVRYDDEEPAKNQMLIRLTDSKLPTTQPRGAALAPGEQRRIELPSRPGASRVACEVTFERNHYDVQSYELPLHTLRQSLSTGPR